MAELRTLGTNVKNRRQIRWIMIVVGSLALAAGIGIFVMFGRGSRKPAPPAVGDSDPVRIAKFAATPEFAQLPLEQKAAYLREMRAHMNQIATAAKSGQISREERMSAARNAISAGARIEMAKYFALPAGPDRQALLDRLIDEQEHMRELGSSAHPEDVPAQGIAVAQMKQFIESLPAEDRVRMAQFGYELFQRRTERGLPMWPYGVK
jgi:hypothetical protein